MREEVAKRSRDVQDMVKMVCGHKGEERIVEMCMYA